MKTLGRGAVLLTAVGCFAAVLAYSNKAQEVLTTGPDAEALMQVERTLGVALNRLDTKAIDQILAEEASIIGVEGRRVTKAEMIADVKSPATSVPAPGVTLDYEEPRARIYGDTGILTGIEVWKKGKDAQDRWSFTDTFVKRDGHWRVVAFHRTRIAKK